MAVTRQPDPHRAPNKDPPVRLQNSGLSGWTSGGFCCGKTWRREALSRFCPSAGPVGSHKVARAHCGQQGPAAPPQPSEAGRPPHLCTRSTRRAISLSEMPGQDSSARLKAFSSSSSAPTPPPLCLCFSLSCGGTTEQVWQEEGVGTEYGRGWRHPTRTTEQRAIPYSAGQRLTPPLTLHLGVPGSMPPPPPERSALLPPPC